MIKEQNYSGTRRQLAARIAGSVFIGFLAGVGIGSLIELFFVAIHSSGTAYTPGVPSFLESFDSEILAVALERGCYGLLGAVWSFTSILAFDENINRRSLPANTALHMFIGLIATMLIGGFLQWFPISPATIFRFILIYLAIYGSFWGFFYWRGKRLIKAVNAELKARKKNTEITDDLR